MSTEPVVLLWSRKWHALEVDEYDTIDDAVMAGMGMVDYEYGSPEYIEVTVDGTTTTYDEQFIFHRSTEIEAERMARRPPPIERPPDPARIEILEPTSGEWVEYSTYSTLGLANDDMELFAPLGDRIRMVTLANEGQ